jgi:MoaA/NifB/PqqE/SkfB family radical SAM enzyme
MNHHYDVEADWLLLDTCNFRCAYCFFSDEMLSAKVQSYATGEKWAEGFDSTGKTWLIHITGGEPSIYPGFIDLCRNLSRNHYLSINSNLSGNCIEEFAETINPKRVHYINAALHYVEREKRKSFVNFVERVSNLRRRGFHVLLSVLMSPDIIQLYPDISARLASYGLAGVPKVMRGNWNGRKYPDAYSDEERSLFLRYLADAQLSYATFLAEMGDTVTINMFADGRFVNGIPSYIGKRCGTGYNFVKIDPEGNVSSCKPKSTLGNILQKNVKLMLTPALCKGSYCPYFCEKYTSPAYIGNQPLGAILLNKLICKCQDLYKIRYSGRTI